MFYDSRDATLIGGDDMKLISKSPAEGWLKDETLKTQMYVDNLYGLTQSDMKDIRQFAIRHKKKIWITVQAHRDGMLGLKIPALDIKPSPISEFISYSQTNAAAAVIFCDFPYGRTDPDYGKLEPTYVVIKNRYGETYK